MDNPNINPDSELVDRFRADLRRPVGERYYSEEELVCIFDNAGDMGSDYLRMEALILGARLYPDSEALLERRAIFYRGFADPAAEEFAADHPGVDRPLWNILNMGLFHGTREQARTMLADYVSSHRFDGDEEMIQFVAIARDFRLADWLYDNLDAILEKCDYKATMLYEIAVSAETDGRADIQIRTLEALTEEEAYCAVYWTMLATAYMTEGRNDDAMNAIDLALAITPDAVDAIKVRLKLLTPSSPEYEPLMRKAFRLDPGDPAILGELLRILSERPDGHSLAEDAMNQAFAATPPSSDTVAIAINYGYSDLDSLLQKLYTAGYTDPEDWRRLADIAYDCGNLEATSELMRVYEEMSGESLNHDFLMLRLLYRMQQYEMAVQLYLAADDSGTIRNRGDLESYGMMVMALLRSGHETEALGLSQALLKTMEESDGYPPFELHGLRKFLGDVIDRLSSGKSTDWNKYDPLGLD